MTVTEKPPFVASQGLLLLDTAVDDPHRSVKSHPCPGFAIRATRKTAE